CEEFGGDACLVLDRMVVAIDGVGEERETLDDGIFVRLDRIEPDDRGVGAAVPLERCRTRRLLAGCDGFGKHIAFGEGLQAADLNGKLPVRIEGRTKAGNDQDQKTDYDALKRHSSPWKSRLLVRRDLRANVTSLSRETSLRTMR